MKIIALILIGCFLGWWLSPARGSSPCPGFTDLGSSYVSDCGR